MKRKEKEALAAQREAKHVSRGRELDPLAGERQATTENILIREPIRNSIRECIQHSVRAHCTLLVVYPFSARAHYTLSARAMLGDAFLITCHMFLSGLQHKRTTQTASISLLTILPVLTTVASISPNSEDPKNQPKPDY
ncbi:proline transporter 2 [Striga asiatica]|uniref:Proline transporter 2 n=1 Tax=Striga asiatica TaxID=4170 RepID=A0A5A7PXQ3_STRAF|nr:proline transporter 2 [Striga asiatica]